MTLLVAVANKFGRTAAEAVPHACMLLLPLLSHRIPWQPQVVTPISVTATPVQHLLRYNFACKYAYEITYQKHDQETNQALASPCTEGVAHLLRMLQQMRGRQTAQLEFR